MSHFSPQTDCHLLISLWINMVFTIQFVYKYFALMLNKSVLNWIWKCQLHFCWKIQCDQKCKSLASKKCWAQSQWKTNYMKICHKCIIVWTYSTHKLKRSNWYAQLFSPHGIIVCNCIMSRSLILLCGLITPLKGFVLSDRMAPNFIFYNFNILN